MSEVILSVEQKKKIKKTHLKYAALGILHGMSYGVFMVAGNVIAILGLDILDLSHNRFLTLLFCLAVDIYCLGSTIKASKEINEAKQEKIKKIIENR